MTETTLFLIPDFCPVCAGPLSVEGDFLYCRSRSCPAKLAGSIKVWIKRLGILHWGDALVDSLTNPDSPKVSSIADLYRLTVDELAECCSGQKIAKKCHSVLHSNKEVSVELLLASLNIPNLAVATATDIVQSGFNTVEKILAMTYEDLLKIPNIGEVTARQAFDGISDRKSVIEELVLVLDIRKPSSGPLSGKSFCITGVTSKNRKEVQKDIMNAGGTVKESVGQGLSFLITNEDPSFNSSKMQKARKYGTEIISEAKLYEMIDGSSP